MALQKRDERSQERLDDDHWIGRRPSWPQITAFLVVGSIGLIIAGVQPIVLGALVNEGRLSINALGWAMTIEFLTLGLSVGLAGAIFPPKHLRVVGVVAALALAAIDAYVTRQAGVGILLNRALAGAVEGILVWLTILMIARSATPARWSGVFLVTQALMQVAFAALTPMLVLPILGANGGFLALAAIAGVGAVSALFLPAALDPLTAAPTAESTRARLPIAAIASLAAVFLLYAFFIGFFAYLEQLAGQAHLTPQKAGLAISLALATSIIGSSAAAALATRVSYYKVFLVCVPINLAVLASLAALPHAGVFIATSGVFGFLWGFLMPFQAPFVIESDPSRRAVLLVPGVQAVGSAAGPLLCSFFVSGGETRGALVLPGACLLIAFAIATVLHLSRVGLAEGPHLERATSGEASG